MFMPDVNILVYAHRRDDVVHAVYREWLDRLVAGPQPFALSVLVAVAFVRIVTHPGIFAHPTPLPLALATIDAIAGHSNCRMIAPGPRHWTLVEKLCRAANATGKVVADAQHAAVAIEHGCEWVTRDRDFERFSSHGLSWKHLIL